MESKINEILSIVGHLGNLNSNICFFGIEPGGYPIQEFSIQTSDLPYVSNNEEYHDKLTEIWAAPKGDNTQIRRLEKMYKYIEKACNGSGYEENNNIYHLKKKVDEIGGFEKIRKQVSNNATKLTTENFGYEQYEIAYRVWACEHYTMWGMATKLLVALTGEPHAVPGINSFNINYAPLSKPTIGTKISDSYQEVKMDNASYYEQCHKKREKGIRDKLRIVNKPKTIICYGDAFLDQRLQIMNVKREDPPQKLLCWKNKKFALRKYKSEFGNVFHMPFFRLTNSIPVNNVAEEIKRANQEDHFKPERF